MALIKYKAGAFFPNQHASNCMRQKWISRHSWSLWREPSHFFSFTTCVLIFSIAKGDKHFYRPSTQTWQNRWQSAPKQDTVQGSSAFCFCLFWGMFFMRLVSCIKSRHMNLCAIIYSHLSNLWKKLLISKRLNLALESDERSIYRQTLRKVLEREKRSSAMDQYGSTRRFFHFLNHKTIFLIQALFHMFV